MGKRAKLFKIGNNKAYNTVIKSRRKNKLAKVLPHLKETEIITKDITTSENKDVIDKTPKLRHRRIKDRTILSRGQKRRKIKKLREEIRKSIPNKVKPQKSVAPKTIEKPLFNLKDIDNTLMDVFEEKDNPKKNKKSAKLSKKDIM